jgi:nucleoside-diphosphate-sugar epimerase
MANAIIGSNGFIGSRLKWYADNFLEEEWIGITRENYELWKGHRFDTVIWAAGTSRKGAEDVFKINTRATMKALRDFSGASKFVYISSQAVYPEGMGKEYDELWRYMSPTRLGKYGISKYYGETAVELAYERGDAGSYLIIRPNGFVGPGLKKNVIYSFAKDPPELYYTWDSKFQIIHTDVFAAVVFMLASSFSGEIFNVTSNQVITPRDVAAALGIDIKSVVQPKDRVPPYVHAVMDTTKLDTILKEANITLPSTEEAISKWNESFEVRMPDLQSSVGRSRGRR